MNRLQSVIFGLVLYYLCSILPAYAEISNHQIFYRQDKRAPLTKIDIVFLGAGSNQEQPAQIGIALTVSKFIREFAKKHGHINQLAVLGTELYVFANTTSLTISISTLSENCAESIEIVRDVIYNFDFSESDLEEVKKKRVADYQNHLGRRPDIFMRSFALAQTKIKKRYKPLKMLKGLLAKDARQYYERLLKTEVVFFKTISNRDSTEVAKLLRPIIEERKIRLLKRLPVQQQTGGQVGGFVHSFVPPVIDHHFGPSAFVFDLNSKNVGCAWLIPYGSIRGPNYIPPMISMTLGRYGARGLLYKYFRDELGLVYSTGINYLSSEYIRFLEIYADPQLHNSEELIVKMSKFIRGLPDNPRFWEEIKELRESRNVVYAHAHAHELLTPQRRLDNEVYRAIHNPPRRKGGSKSITDAEVRAFLEKFFVPENMIMIFVGPKDHIIDILNKHLPEVDIRVHDVKELIE